MHPPAPPPHLGRPGRRTLVVVAVGLAVGLAGLLLAWTGGPHAPAVAPAAPLGAAPLPTAPPPEPPPAAASRDVLVGTTAAWRCECAWRDGTTGRCLVPIWCPCGLRGAAGGVGPFLGVSAWR